MTNPAGEVVEGNISDLDLDAKFFILEDRSGKAFIKIYWKAAHDEKMRKQKVGYYEAPLVTMEEKTGGMQEATLIDLPFKDRGDFPRIQKKGGFSGSGRPFQPRNERPIIMQVIFKEACETARQQMQMCEKFEAAEADAAWEWAVAKTEASMERLCKIGGV